eukprot:gene6241-biopygen12638
MQLDYCILLYISVRCGRKTDFRTSVITSYRSLSGTGQSIVCPWPPRRRPRRRGPTNLRRGLGRLAAAVGGGVGSINRPEGDSPSVRRRPSAQPGWGGPGRPCPPRQSPACTSCRGGPPAASGGGGVRRRR